MLTTYMYQIYVLYICNEDLTMYEEIVCKTMTTSIQMLYMHLLFVFMIGNIDHVVVIEGAVPSPLVGCIAEPSNNNIDSPSYHGASSDGAKKNSWYQEHCRVISILESCHQPVK